MPSVATSVLPAPAEEIDNSSLAVLVQLSLDAQEAESRRVEEVRCTLRESIASRQLRGQVGRAEEKEEKEEKGASSGWNVLIVSIPCPSRSCRTSSFQSQTGVLTATCGTMLTMVPLPLDAAQYEA